MGLKPYLGPTLAAFFVCAAYSALAQTVPAATESRLPLAIGAGFSGYNPDFGHGHLLGGTLWIDYSPNRVPSFLRGIGIEAEARDLNYGRSSTEWPDLREDIVQGGLIYSWPHFRKFRPYGKFSEGYGNTDYGSSTVGPYHDSRTIFSGGGGVEYRVFQRVWVRADYEYQSWPNFFKHTLTGAPPGRLNPQGFTLGAMYHFNYPHFH
ncbi:MAG: outer membrane beta-barrel protein [Terracidiphilus sp.]|jgi:opacity protein-like surface antigen